MSTFLGEFDTDLAASCWSDVMLFAFPLAWFDESLISFERTAPIPMFSFEGGGVERLREYLLRYPPDFMIPRAEPEPTAISGAIPIESPIDDTSSLLAELRELMILAHPDRPYDAKTAEELTARLSALRDRIRAFQDARPGVVAQVSGATPRMLGGNVPTAVGLTLAIGGTIALVAAWGPVGGVVAVALGIAAWLIARARDG